MRINKISALLVIFIIITTACTPVPKILDNLEDPPLSDDFRSTESPLQTESPVGSNIDLENLFIPFWESWEILHDEFVNQPLDDEAMVAGAIDGLTSFYESRGIDYENLTQPTDKEIIQTLAIRAKTPIEVEDLFLPFWGVWIAGVGAEMDAGMTYENMMQSALHGLVDSLGDPHTFYMDPDQYRQLNIPLEGEYEGIGAWVDTTGEYLTIITPMQDSPAERAGLKPKDKVIAVDGEDMTGIVGNLVIRKVVGPAGSTVVLTIEREGNSDPFDVEITRELIILTTLESRMEDNQIGYIHLFNFGANSARDFHSALSDLLEQNARGIVVDLRNNGGGFLHSAVSIASEFFPDGVVLIEEYQDGSRDISYVEDGGLAIDVPIVVLINQGSASASEIVAGMIQDLNRGPLVGATSFGKGSAQINFVLTDDRGGLRVTIAKWLTPNERLIHNIGLTPDFMVEITEEDFEADIDPQLDRAIELLLGIIG